MIENAIERILFKALQLSTGHREEGNDVAISSDIIGL